MLRIAGRATGYSLASARAGWRRRINLSIYEKYKERLDKIDQINKLVYMKTMEIGAFEAKTHLSALLEKVRQGKTFFITKHGQPVAELRPVMLPNRRPRFACDRNRVTIRGDFEAPIPDLKDYTE